MISGFDWPDIVIVAVVGLLAYKGWRRGFVLELGGALAIVAGLVAPRYYNGAADAAIDGVIHAGLPVAHVVGVLLTGVVAYVIVLAIAAVLNRLMKLPVLGLGNGLAGAAVGFAKGAILVWLVLFVALFFPLTPDARDALAHAYLVSYFTAPDAAIDGALEAAIPPFFRPYADPYFARHKV